MGDLYNSELTEININNLPEGITKDEAIEYNQFKTDLEMVLNTVSLNASENPDVLGSEIVSESHILMDELEIPNSVRSTFKKLFANPQENSI